MFVTDIAFRSLFVKHGKPDVLWTEFVANGGIIRQIPNVLADLRFNDDEHPIVAQIFGGNPSEYEIVARKLVKMGFDGIDLNMGCPDRNVQKQGAGAALIQEPRKAQEIIYATMNGTNGDVPVSVKTRLGFNHDSIDTWIRSVAETQPATLTIHARTRKEMSDVPARWDAVRMAVDMIRNDMENHEMVILGNGDVTTMYEVQEKCDTYGVDGVMIGRGAFGNPWLFSNGTSPANISIKDRLLSLAELTDRFACHVQPYGKSFAVCKKHFKAFCSGFNGAKELRYHLMQKENAEQVKQTINEYIENHL